VVLYVIGGVTYAEISGFRKVARKSGINIVICASNVINYKSMIDAFKTKSGEIEVLGV
jgi:Sec1 family